jgi:ribosomal protein S18 acetylase RimI-like enzyme
VNDDVRLARPDDVPAIADALASAFLTDPVMVWALPAMNGRGRELRRLYAAIARYEAIPAGTTLLAEDASRVAGVAVWRRRGRRGRPSWRDIAFALSAGRALGRDMTRMAALGRAASRARPRVPHWYLQLLGVAAGTQRTGFGSALVRRQLTSCDAEGLPAYLETTEENLAFYARFGFRTTHEITIARRAPLQYSLWRDPVL